MTQYARAKPETQAIRAIAAIKQTKVTNPRTGKEESLIQSVGTYRNYQECLKHVCAWIQAERMPTDLKHLTIEQANAFLHAHAEHYGQKSLDMHRQAMQALLHKELEGGKLEIVKTGKDEKLEHRAYTREQVERVAACQSAENAFSTRLAYAAGLRAHELLTIRRAEEQPADIRHNRQGEIKNLDSKFKERDGVLYTVNGKGGLIREVLVPRELAKELEERRLAEPRTVTDRTVRYEQYYDLKGGQPWSNSFSAASERALGWSTGAHGLRHSYAQERLAEAGKNNEHEKALETVSQELGHFRPEITLTYLR